MTRKESTSTMIGEDGVVRQIRILDAITVDDIMLAMMKGAANEIANGVPYTSPLSAGVRNYLTRARVSTGG